MKLTTCQKIKIRSLCSGISFVGFDTVKNNSDIDKDVNEMFSIDLQRILVEEDWINMANGRITKEERAEDILNNTKKERTRTFLNRILS